MVAQSPLDQLNGPSPNNPCIHSDLLSDLWKTTIDPFSFFPHEEHIVSWGWMKDWQKAQICPAKSSDDLDDYINYDGNGVAGT